MKGWKIPNTQMQKAHGDEAVRGSGQVNMKDVKRQKDQIGEMKENTHTKAWL